MTQRNPLDPDRLNALRQALQKAIKELPVHNQRRKECIDALEMLDRGENHAAAFHSVVASLDCTSPYLRAVSKAAKIAWPGMPR